MAHEPIERFESHDEEDAPPPEERPDWLIGADQDIVADPQHRPPPPELRRPPPPIPLPSGAPSAPPPPKPWTGASSSIPRLTEVAAAPSRPQPAARVPEDEPVEKDSPEDDFLSSPAGPEFDRVAASTRASATPRRPALAPAPEPFWVVWMDVIAGDRRLQIALGAALVVVLALLFWPRGGGGGTSISAIKHHPSAYEGRTVRVDGRIGDVFVVGQGYVFNLHQGRDTIVVFTRLRSPRSRDRTRVGGSVSTGYLDGVARVALFETEAPR